MLIIRLLGRAVIEGPEGHPISGRGTQRARLALLALLASACGRGMSRDRVMALLWPDADAERARHQLRDSVYRLRVVLGDETIITAGDELRLVAGRIRCDVWEMEEAAAKGALELALNLYTGPFLDGYHLADSAEFEDWAREERERLARVHGGVLESMARQTVAAGDTKGAVDLWRRRASAEPYAARLAVELMQALEAAGDRAGAIQHAAQYAARLEAELGAVPEPEVVALAERLRRSPAPTSGAAPLSPRRPAAAPAYAPAEESEAGSRLLRPRRADKHPRSHRWHVLAAMAILAFALGAFLIIVPRATPAVEDDLVLVAPLANHTGDASLAFVGMMAADWIAQGLARSGSVRVIPIASSVAAVRQDEVRRAEHARLPDDIRLGRELKVRIVVSGAFYRSGDSLLLQLRLTDATRGVMLRPLAAIVVGKDDAIQAIDRAREVVATELVPLLDPRMAEYVDASSRPPNIEAYAAYVAGIEAIVVADWRSASDHFARAHAVDSAYTMPLLMHAIARFNDGDHSTADSLAKRASSRRETLPPYDRAALESLSAWLQGDHAAAYQAARRGSVYTPNGFVSAQVAVEALRLNRPREALRVLEGLDFERGELRGVHFHFEDRAHAQHALGRHGAELRTARAARARHPDVAEFRVLELRALAAAGRRELRDTLAAIVSASSPQTGTLLRAAALELRTHGRSAEAAQLNTTAVRWYESLPDSIRQRERTRFELARLHYELGNRREARQLIEPLVAADPQIREYRVLLGVLAAHDGDDEAASTEVWLTKLDDPYLWGRGDYWRAAIAASSGDADRALELLRAAFRNGLPYTSSLHTDVRLESLWKDRRFRGLIKPAG